MRQGMARTGLRTLERPALVSVRAARQILGAIAAGTFAVGDRLPTEQELARQLGVSRPSVREALSALQFAGYVESRRGGRTVVVADEPSIPAVVAPPALVGPDDVLDLLEARLILEPHVLALAALDPEPAALASAKPLVEGMQLLAAEPELPAASDLRVHAALIDICRNVFLGREAKRLLELASGPHWEDARRHAWSDRELRELWARQHAQVWAAIAAGRAGDAERAGRAHLVSVITNVLGSERLSSRERSRLHDIVERFDDDGGIASLWHRMSRREAATPIGEP